MPTSPPRWCARCSRAHSGACPALVAARRGANRPPDNRPDSTARGYDWTWERLSRMIRRERPICEHCGVAPSRMVDHIVPLRAGGARLDLANLQALCLPCHASKTRSERRRR
jgi:5-methylcytosine-specific restriction protein A